jgi:hypothetical protein
MREPEYALQSRTEGSYRRNPAEKEHAKKNGAMTRAIEAKKEDRKIFLMH